MATTVRPPRAAAFPSAAGFVGYLLAYQVLTSAAALRGYGQYLVGSGRRWK